MDRYDWERGPWFPGTAAPTSYDRGIRGGSARSGRGYGPGRPGGYRWGRQRIDEYEGDYGGHDRHFRYSYPGGPFGGRGGYGRQEPWESGPPGGYGSQWRRVYGNRGSRPYDASRSRGRGYGSDWFDRYPPSAGGAGRTDAYGQAPPGYDGYGPEAFFDHESDGLGEWSAEPDDDAVRGRVWSSLHDDGFINADSIQVEVKDRVVTLRGEVSDYMEARYAWDDAWEAPGVRGVISKLTVAGSEKHESPQGAARTARSSGKRKKS